jgi:hypothetical protein
MREFTDIQHDLQLKKFLESPLGTMYFVPYEPGRPRVIVRHFDRDLPPSLVPAFASLTRAAQEWIAGHPALDRLVRVAQPLEIGRDFITRDHFTYYTSTSSYQDDDEDERPPEPPGELVEMRQAFKDASDSAVDAAEAIVQAVLTRSLLEPTGKTFFHEGEGRFIVVELKPTKDEVERWSTIAGPRS